MKKNYFFFVMLAIATSLNAQPWMKQIPQTSNTFKEPKPANFYEIQSAFEKYWSDKQVSENENENAKKGGYQQFKRWAHMMRYRTYPTGEMFDTDILSKEFLKLKGQALNKGTSVNATAAWNYIGQNMIPTGGGGTGRINVMRIDPTNNNVLYIGAACGGVWKSIDAGNTWTTTTDFLPSISIADIAINPIHTDSVYIATGDGYAYEVGGDFWGGLYTGGIYVSGDGGATWNITSPSFIQGSKNVFQRLLINPQNPNVLMTCSRTYVYRSDNAGQTWVRVLNGHFYDLEFQPGNPSVVYACNGTKVYKSVDGGLTFAQNAQGLGAGRMSISVTAANPNVLYALSENGNFWKSTDAGVTFTAKTSPTGFTTFYGYYDNVLSVSPADENLVITGGVDLLQSPDGGTSWSLAANNGGADYVHVDQKNVEFESGSETNFYAVNDGGIFKTTDGGITWTDIGAGIHIKQYYKMATSLSSPAIMYAGAQDNGTDQFTGTIWRKVYGGDGMDCAADQFNSQYAYVSSQYGNFRRTTNGGASTANITPSGQTGDWVTPIAIDPVNSQTIYIGYQSLWRSFNQGTNWTNISNNVLGGDITVLKIAPSNTNYIYAGNLGLLKKSTDGGITFSSITSGLSISALTDIAISSSNPDNIWITLSGYVAGKKVYASTDGGITWTNVSGTLPNLPVNCAVYQPGSNEMLYVGTDIGVFYKDNSMNDWQPYNNALPHVTISELEIVPSTNKIRAATYGRGIWEADLSPSTFPLVDAGLVTFNSFPQIICTSNYIPDVILKNLGSSMLNTATINYSLDNGAWQSTSWTGNISSLATSNFSLPSFTLADGAHTLAVAITNPNGTSDPNTFNDSIAVSFIVNSTSTIPPVVEDFETSGAPFNFNISDPNNILTITNQAGAYGTSTSSIKADFYNVSYGSAEMISLPLDMTVFANTPQLTFDVAYRFAPTVSRDSLKVLISTDCGITWITAYAKTTTQLATATGSYIPPFLPTSTQWRNELVSLAPYATASHLLIRFDFISAYGNNLYVDNINIQQTTGVNEVAQQQFKVFPNPATSALYLQTNQNINEPLAVIISDIANRSVSKHVINSLAANEKFLISTENYSQGFYNVSVLFNDGKRMNVPVVISAK